MNLLSQMNQLVVLCSFLKRPAPPRRGGPSSCQPGEGHQRRHARGKGGMQDWEAGAWRRRQDMEMALKVRAFADTCPDRSRRDYGKRSYKQGLTRLGYRNAAPNGMNVAHVVGPYANLGHGDFCKMMLKAVYWWLMI